MHSELFSIGPFTVYGYGLMIGIGIAAALFVGDYRARKRGMNGDVLYGMTFTAVLLGFLCARILFILTEWRGFLQDPISYITGQSGFVVYGGIIGGILIVYGYCRIKKLHFIDYYDLMMPSVALAQGFGRIGCFLAGCCYGRETDSIFGIAFHDSPYAPNGIRLIPTQLMMSAGDFLIAAVLFAYARKERTKGKTGTLYLILYSIGRFVIEFFRDDDRGSIWRLSTSQAISIFTLTAALFLFFLYFPGRENKEKSDAAGE